MHMKTFVMAFLLFIIPAVSYAQPAIVFKAETHDFGTVTAGDVIEHTFDFTNAGDKELIIQKVGHS